MGSKKRSPVLGQRPQMGKIRGYVGVWLSAEELDLLLEGLEDIAAPAPEQPASWRTAKERRTRQREAKKLCMRINIAAVWAANDRG